MKGHTLAARLGFAAAGLRAAYARERSFRTHCRFAVAAAGALVVLRPAPMWWGLVALTIALVLAFELVNSALEGFIDLVRPDIHPEIKVIKDMAAGAVLLRSMAALVVAGAMVVDTGPRRVAEWTR